MITIAETREFVNKVSKLLDDNEQKNIVNYLSNHPKAGIIIQGSGGIRKLRWGRDSKGKSGGIRLIYYYHSERMPLDLMTVYGKGEKDNLTKLERNELLKLTDILQNIWLGD